MKGGRQNPPSPRLRRTNQSSTARVFGTDSRLLGFWLPNSEFTPYLQWASIQTTLPNRRPQRPSTQTAPWCGGRSHSPRTHTQRWPYQRQRPATQTYCGPGDTTTVSTTGGGGSDPNSAATGAGGGAEAQSSRPEQAQRRKEEQQRPVRRAGARRVDYEIDHFLADSSVFQFDDLRGVQAIHGVRVPNLAEDDLVTESVFGQHLDVGQPKRLTLRC